MKANVLLIATLFAVGTLQAQTTTFTGHDSLQSRDQILHEIKSDDPSRISFAVQRIHVWIDNGLNSADLCDYWLPALMKAQRYQDVADCGLLAVLNADDIRMAENCMKFRAQALMQLNKPQLALVAAKSYYNVCRTKDLQDAIDLVATCFNKCYPNNSDIADRFRAAQAVTGIATSPSLLEAVVVNDSLFEDAIEQRRVEPQDVNHFINYGNLLLIADRCSEAEKIFREQFRRAETKQQLASATEAIARCLKAEDGNPARANQWLQLSQQEDKSAVSQANRTPAQNK